MKSLINDDFLRAYRRLPKEVREQARKAYQQFKEDPSYPGLHFNPIHPSQPFYSARIGRGPCLAFEQSAIPRHAGIRLTYTPHH